MTLTKKQMEYGKLVASGVTPIDAYVEAYGCTRAVASRNAARGLRSPAMKQFLDELLAETRKQVMPLRDEVREFLTGTMRDETREMTDRLKAAKQLAELEGFTTQHIEVQSDTTFRAALVASATREPMVRGEEGE